MKLVNAQLTAEGYFSCLKEREQFYQLLEALKSKHRVLKRIRLEFCIFIRYLESVNFYFGAGCMIGQHLKEKLFTYRQFGGFSFQFKISYCMAETVSSLIALNQLVSVDQILIHHQVRDRSTVQQALPLMTAERTGTCIPELLKAAEIFIVVKPEECFLRIVRLLETNGGLSFNENHSSITKHDLVFVAPLWLS